MKENEDKSICTPQYEDYMECLHHKKEFARLNKIEDYRRKAEAPDDAAGGGGGH
eukprot:CAMPEP_0118895720 /NCGR_PEP_ID=MMETSP1166-20130328/3944_1 /TAXON_ID=1104430 /ORGANISM="Chrysoreinhardia sp, Strain CCMP3193" /LENGTH=53 /DNA_ID=CAMNT_0006834767 /DNA_START=114 /DNA_END=275 /DNA_ORIENTATION=+